MNDKPKTKVIDSTEVLGKEFVQTFDFQEDGGISVRPARFADGRSELRFEAGHAKSILEVWPRLNPSRKLLLVGLESEKPFLLLCPHIPDSLGADLRSSGINHADLNGRLFIKTPSFLLDRRPTLELYRNPSSAINPFSLKTSRIIRALLSHRDREWVQADLEARTHVSRALVSLTLAELIEKEWVAQTRQGNRHVAALYKVKDFDGLLNAWAEEDKWRKRVIIQQYSVLSENLFEVAESARDALGVDNVYFTQWFAAHLRHPHTTPPLVSAYLQKKLPVEISWARKVDNGGNLWLILSKDEGIFQETQNVNGFNLVSDIQIYLDLLQVSQRGPEQAEALRAWERFAR